jgi:hypothetical protein
MTGKLNLCKPKQTNVSSPWTGEGWGEGEKKKVPPPLYPLPPGAGKTGKGPVPMYKHGRIEREIVDFVP